MMDPERLIDEGATDFEAALLRAGRRDAISKGGRQRVLLGLGIGAGVLAGASASAAASVAPTGKLAGASVALFKYLGIGGLAALAVWGGVHGWQSRVSARHPVVPVEPTGDVAEVSEVSEPPQTIAEAAPVPTVVGAPPAMRPRSTQAREARDAREERVKDSLPKELAYLDRARRELSAGHPARALRVLDEYQGLFPSGRLGAEATVLRIESLARAGDRAGVVAAGKDFLAKHPNGPYATRVRSLMGEPRPAGPP